MLVKKIEQLPTGIMIMKDVFICDAIRTPIGRYGGALSTAAPLPSDIHSA